MEPLVVSTRLIMPRMTKQNHIDNWLWFSESMWLFIWPSRDSIILLLRSICSEKRTVKRCGRWPPRKSWRRDTAYYMHGWRLMLGTNHSQWIIVWNANVIIANRCQAEVNVIIATRCQAFESRHLIVWIFVVWQKIIVWIFVVWNGVYNITLYDLNIIIDTFHQVFDSFDSRHLIVWIVVVW